MLIPLGILAAAGAGGAGAAGAYELIQSSILTSDTASVTFSSIPQTYKHLQIRAVTRSATNNTNANNLMLFANGDTGNNYASHLLFGNGAGIGSTSVAPSLAFPYVGYGTGNLSTTGAFSASVIDVLDYSSSSKNTTFRALAGHANDATRIGLFSAVWLNTNAVTSLQIRIESQNSLSGSRFSLYGIKG